MFGKTNTFVKHTGNYFMPTNSEERPRVYLNKVHLKGFKSIEDVTIDFQKGLNILIGKNGAGKSNFLEVVNSSILYKRFEKNDFQFAKLEFISDDRHGISFEIIEKKQVRNNLEDEESGFYEEKGALEKITFDNDVVYDSSEGSVSRRAIKIRGRSVGFTGISRFIQRIGYLTEIPLLIKFDLPVGLGCIERAGEISIETDDQYNLWSHPETLKFMNLIFLDLYIEDIIKDKPLPELNASDVYSHLKIPDVIIDNLKLFTPINDVRFNSNINLYFDGAKLIVDNVKLEFRINDNWLPWAHLSDGTRRLFYIVSEVTNTNGLILLEEPELGVHPHQFHLLMNFLKDQSEHKQIIISTHAPKALDYLNFDELNNILITYYDPEKGTQLKHLSEGEKAKAVAYANEVGFLSDYWLHSDLEG